MTTPIEAQLRGLPLLNAAMDLLAKNRRLHDQGVYLARDDYAASPIEDPTNPDCGVYGCIAGWSVILAGHKPDWDPNFRAICLVDGGRPIRSAAAEALELTEQEAARLFSGANDWHEIVLAVEGIRQRMATEQT